jgi:ADP-ribose pyrophosphatase YjhB (NUDIX family)
MPTRLLDGRDRVVTWVLRQWWRIAKPRTFGVKAIVTDPEGRVLLVSTAADPVWMLPGGGVRAGEHPRAATIRELTEETSLCEADLHVPGLFAIYIAQGEAKRDTIVVYTVRTEARTVEPAAEVRRAGFFALDALPEGTSPATRRLLAERFEGAEARDEW